jgi:hypothetical protein
MGEYDAELKWRFIDMYLVGDCLFWNVFEGVRRPQRRSIPR